MSEYTELMKARMKAFYEHGIGSEQMTAICKRFDELADAHQVFAADQPVIQAAIDRRDMNALRFYLSRRSDSWRRESELGRCECVYCVALRLVSANGRVTR